MRCILALVSAAFLLGGWLIRVKDRTLEIAADTEGWRTPRGLVSRSDASYHGRLADLLVSARADDPYTAVRLRVRPGAAAAVTLSREDPAPGDIGAWRLTDRKSHYVGTRVPRTFGFGEAVSVPPDTDLVVEFDPGTVHPGSSLAGDDPIQFDLRVQVGNELEAVAVRLRVVDTHRGWYVGFAGH